MTNPFQFYQFWINADDADVPKLLRYFSRKSRVEIEALDAQMCTQPNVIKKALAEEVTQMVHGAGALTAVSKVTELLYGRSFDQQTIHSLAANDFEMLRSELPHFNLNNDVDNISMMELLTERTNIFASKGEAKRAFQANSIQVNRKKIADANFLLNRNEFIAGKYLLIEVGKKNKYVIAVE